MQFTDKEIELAKQMKEAGLEWTYQEGDWYMDEEGDIECLTHLTIDWWNTGYVEGKGPIRNKIWLPLWHKCREIIRALEPNAIITLSESLNSICVSWTILFTWTILSGDGNPVIQRQMKADTDLEAMYRIILELLQIEVKDDIPSEVWLSNEELHKYLTTLNESKKK